MARASGGAPKQPARVIVGIDTGGTFTDVTLLDPATGQSLGAPERFLGVVKVETVLERFSTASVLSGDGIGRGHVVRLKGATPR